MEYEFYIGVGHQSKECQNRKKLLFSTLVWHTSVGHRDTRNPRGVRAS